MHSVSVGRRHAQQESVSSCPFASSVSREACFVPGPDMEVDGLLSALRDDNAEGEPDPDIPMVSPSVVHDEDDEVAEHRFLRGVAPNPHGHCQLPLRQVPLKTVRRQCLVRRFFGYSIAWSSDSHRCRRSCSHGSKTV